MRIRIKKVWRDHTLEFRYDIQKKTWWLPFWRTVAHAWNEERAIYIAKHIKHSIITEIK